MNMKKGCPVRRKDALVANKQGIVRPRNSRGRTSHQYLAYRVDKNLKLSSKGRDAGKFLTTLNNMQHYSLKYLSYRFSLRTFFNVIFKNKYLAMKIPDKIDKENYIGMSQWLS